MILSQAALMSSSEASEAREGGTLTSASGHAAGSDAPHISALRDRGPFCRAATTSFARTRAFSGLSLTLLLVAGLLRTIIASPEAHAGPPFTQGEEAYIIHVNGVGVIYSSNDTPLVSDKQALVNQGWSIVYDLRWGMTPNAEAQNLYNKSAQGAGNHGITVTQAMDEVLYAQTDLNDGSCPSPGGKWKCSKDNRGGLEFIG